MEEAVRPAAEVCRQRLSKVESKMAGGADVAELVRYLESGDVEVISEIKQVVFENLHASKDATIFNALFESFLKTKSSRLLEILASVNESHSQYLFDRMNELVKTCNYAETTSIFAAIIRKQPSWLYKVVGSLFFTQYLKTLKMETDVTFVMGGAVIISMLLPCVPSLVAPHLGDILEIFVRMASFIIHKPGPLPDVLVLHLQIGVYILFQRLYSMYPNNFLSYMRSCFGSNTSDPVFRHVIEPMMQFVKFHSGLINDTLKSETENLKWKTSQPHDIYAACQKISLDPLDAIKEATYTVFSPGLLAHGVYPAGAVVVGDAVSTNLPTSGRKVNKMDKEIKRLDSAEKPKGKDDSISYLSSQDISLQWSPSFICGLSTPPSSRPLSPATSTQDMLAISEFAPRPMTPVLGSESKDAANYYDDAYAPTPVFDRRSSAGDLKRSTQKPFTAAMLNVKSKSTDSVDMAIDKTDNQGSGEALNTAVNQSRQSTPPRKKRDKTADIKRSSVHSVDLPIKQADKGGSRETLEYNNRTQHSTPPRKKRDKTADVKRNSVHSVDLPIKQADKERSKETLEYNNRNQQATPPRKRKEKAKKLTSSVHSSPQQPAQEKTSFLKAKESSSAPTTPRAVTKNSFPFISTPQGNEEQTRSTSKLATPVSEPERLLKQRSLHDRSESLLNEMSVELVKIIQNLHEEALSKQGVNVACEDELATDNDHFLKLQLKSPFELLDEFIECGSSLHSLQLSKIPITSQLDTDWTYFGGYTPADELSILRAQVNLLEVQLQYERQKCNQHVFRNRRLVGKVHKAQAFEEELAASKNKIDLLDAELCEAKIVIRHQDDEIKKLRDLKNVLENEKTKSLKLYTEENLNLKYSVEELSSELHTRDLEKSAIDRELSRVQCDLFNKKLEVDFMKPKLEVNDAAQIRAENLSKELLSLKETHEKAKRYFHSLRIGGNQNEQYEQLVMIDALKNEIRDYKYEMEDLVSSLDAARLKISELEAALAKRELAIKDQKAHMDSLCHKYTQNSKVLEDRYKCLKKASQGMESYILYLLKKIEENNKRLHTHHTHTHHDKPQRTHSQTKKCHGPSEKGRPDNVWDVNSSEVIEIGEKFVDDSGIESSELDRAAKP